MYWWEKAWQTYKRINTQLFRHRGKQKPQAKGKNKKISFPAIGMGIASKIPLNKGKRVQGNFSEEMSVSQNEIKITLLLLLSHYRGFHWKQQNWGKFSCLHLQQLRWCSIFFLPSLKPIIFFPSLLKSRCNHQKLNRSGIHFCYVTLYILSRWVSNIEGFRPEWCVSSIYHAWETPFWSGTLDIRQV